MLNKVILMGRLTKEPELKTTQQGVSVCTFSIAVDRGFARQGEEKQTDFINIVAWRSTAEFASKYFTKGQMISLVGRIQTRNYEDNEGKRVYVTEVIADEVYFAESKKNDAQTQAPAMEVVPDDGDLPF